MATSATSFDFKHIAHPTDFAAAGEPAFAHALRLAVASKSHFYLVHAEYLEPGEDADWDAFPGVRSTLCRWGLLPADAEPAAVAQQLGVRVTKADVPDRNPADGVLRFIEDNQAHLLVLATRAGNDGHGPRRGSVAETVARRAGIPALFLPWGVPGFVDPRSGATSLRNILQPIDLGTPPGAAASLALRLADMLGCGDAVLHALHVGDPSRAPTVGVAAEHEPRVRRLQAEGPLIETIVAQADAVQADLIVSVTHGRDGLLDHLRGSTTEQILHQAQRPLLAVPAP
jgi:nucleotide-binding universal stress UspA family protein